MEKTKLSYILNYLIKSLRIIGIGCGIIAYMIVLTLLGVWRGVTYLGQKTLSVAVLIVYTCEKTLFGFSHIDSSNHEAEERNSISQNNSTEENPYTPPEYLKNKSKPVSQMKQKKTKSENSSKTEEENASVYEDEEEIKGINVVYIPEEYRFGR